MAWHVLDQCRSAGPAVPRARTWAVSLGAIAALAWGSSSAISDRLDEVGVSTQHGGSAYRLVLPGVAGGARIHVPEPFQRDPNRAGVFLADTVIAVPVIDESGAAGIQITETLTESYYVWFPEMGRVAVFQGFPEYSPGCNCDVYDLGWMRMQPYLFDEQRLLALTNGTYRP